MPIYLYDRMRHLVCVPYSVDGLHTMADHLGIPRHWYHGGKHPHYDIPKRDISRIRDRAIEVPPRVILKVIQGVEDGDLGSYMQVESPGME